MHNVQHHGTTNSFLVSSRSDVAIKYNDISVGENYSLAVFFELIENDPEANIFDGLPHAEWVALRRRVIKLVHSTDLEKHISIMDKFKTRLVAKDFDPTKEEHMILLMKVIMKCADLSCFTRPLEVSRDWATRLSEEYYNEGDREREIGIKPTKFMDRKMNNIVGLQIVAANAAVLPLWKLWAQFTGDDMPLKLIEQNVEVWKKEVKRGNQQQQQQQQQQYTYHNDDADDKKTRKTNDGQENYNHNNHKHNHNHNHKNKKHGKEIELEVSKESSNSKKQKRGDDSNSNSNNDDIA